MFGKLIDLVKTTIKSIDQEFEKDLTMGTVQVGQFTANTVGIAHSGARVMTTVTPIPRLFYVAATTLHGIGFVTNGLAVIGESEGIPIRWRIIGRTSYSSALLLQRVGDYLNPELIVKPQDKYTEKMINKITKSL